MKTEDNSTFKAEWWRRLLNLLIDTAFIWVITNFIFTKYVEKFTVTRDFFWISFAFVSSFVFFFAYYFFFEFFWNKTPGKFLTRTKVVDLSGHKPAAWQIMRRSLVRFVFFDYLSFFGRRPAGWHDDFSNTRVVKNSLRGSVSFDKKKRSKTTKVFNGLILGFYAFVYLFAVAAPFVVFSNWEDLKEVQVQDYEWQEREFAGINMIIPGNVAAQGQDSWRVFMGGIKSIEINRLPTDANPEEVLSMDIALQMIHPQLMVRFSEYEEIETKDRKYIFYKYSFEQAPVSTSGFFFFQQGVWYQVRMQGFKHDGEQIIRHILDYSIGQETQE